MVARNAEADTAAATGVSSFTHDEAWTLAGRLSPRSTIRVAARDASGIILNKYDRTWPLAESAPSTTWAMFLADEDLRFHYLGFDFDVTEGNAARDSDRMSYWLDELNIPHLTCVSGASGGRHIWVHLDEPADAAIVRELTLLTKDLLPSLDTKPMLNPAAGCLRPPYAPHRVAGHSQPTGLLTTLTDHAAGEDAVPALIEMLRDLGAELPPVNTALPHGVVFDEGGHPRIRGPKRSLSARMDAILHGPAGNDASHTLAHVLIGCANARWSYSDITALAATAPSFEHARTRRVGGSRVPRTPAQTTKVLTAAWKYAVTFVATNPRSTFIDDPEYRQRMADVLVMVERARERADALPGRWVTHNRRVQGSHAQRAVLDALCLYMLQSSRPVVEADVRRLSADTGYGRTSVHTALQALAATGDGPAWIQKVGEAEGVNAQRYRLHERFSTGEEAPDRTQARMRAITEPSHPRTQALIREIGHRLQLLAHDVFCAPGSLGRVSGLLFASLSEEGAVTFPELVQRTGLDPDKARRRLLALAGEGLVVRDDGRWRRHSPTARDFVARRLSVNGYLAERRERYELERKVWAWWQAEVTWMDRRGKHRKGKRTSGWFEADRPDYVAYPRGPSRRGDHGKAMALVKAGILERGLALAA